jgi:transposase-like protein
MLRSCDSKSGVLLLRLTRPNPMNPIPPERREAILGRLSWPAREPVARVAAQEGISSATLYLWRRKALRSGALLPDHDEAPEGWSAV